MQALAASLMLLLAACATTPAGPPAVANGELDNAADGTRIAIKRGGEVKVILDANLTTGFQWQTPSTPAPVLSPIGERAYAPRSADARKVGAGGMNIFRFRGDNPGQATLQFDYRRPWETTVAPAKTVRYVISVE
jgi:predicted secreted protein